MMFSKFFSSPEVSSNIVCAYSFSTKEEGSVGVIRLVKNPNQIDKDTARTILVESFIGEYQKYLAPHEIGTELTSWREGNNSVRQYYENYFDTEFKEFSHGAIDYWVEATINGKLVGWATFQRERSNPNAIYMNLLVVHPEYQGRAVGSNLVYAPSNLRLMPDLSAIHLLLRKKNEGGRVFYSKLGFTVDPHYHRGENFVDLNLLEALTWRRPSLQNAVDIHQENDTYCGFAPGFLLNKSF